MDSESGRHVGDVAMARLAGFLGSDRSLAGGAVPAMIGRYRVVRLVAEGATARVYEAEDLQLGRRVAVKVMSGDASDPIVRRFHREASLAARLRHPGIIVIHEVSMVRREDGSPMYFIVMDYHERSLEELRRKGELSRTERLKLVEAVARAVHYAHEQGVIHRDLKPANILVDRMGRAIVSDFGLAREETQMTQLTRSGAPLGTPHYMSPEQAAGKVREIGPRSDIYALGVILYELMVSRLPFDGTSVGEVYAAILTKEAPRLRAVDPTVDRDVEKICLKAMDKDRRQRYDSAAEVADDLARYLTGEPIQAQTASFTRRALRRIHHGRWGLVAGVACVAIAVGAVVAERAVRRAEDAREREVRKAHAYADAYESALKAWNRLDAATAGGIDSSEWLHQNVREVGALVDRAIEADPSRADPHILRYRLRRLLGEFAGARESLADALRLDPNHAEAAVLDVRERAHDYLHLQLGRIPMMADGKVIGSDSPAARERCEADLAKVKRNPDVPPHHIALIEAMLHFGSCRWEEAIRGFTIYLEHERWDAQIWALLAGACSYLGRAAESEAHIVRAIQLRKERPYMVMRAYLRRGRGDLKGAIEDCSDALRGNPDDIPALVERGNIRCASGDYAAAVEDYSRVLELQADYAQVRFFRAGAYRAQQRYPESIEDLDKIEAPPHLRTMALLERGMAEQLGGKCMEALATYSRAIKEGVESLRGEAFLRRGNCQCEHARHAQEITRERRAQLLRAAISDENEALALKADGVTARAVRGRARLSLEGCVEGMDAPERRQMLKDAIADLEAYVARPRDAHQAQHYAADLEEAKRRLGQFGE